MPDLSSYSLSINWFLTWFSMSSARPMDAYMDNGTNRYSSTEKGVRKGPGAQVLLGASWKDAASAAGWIDVSTDVRDVFSLELKMMLGRQTTTQKISAPPNFADGFFLRLVGDRGDRAVAGTQLLLSGTLKTGPRLIEYAIAKQPSFTDK